MKRLVFALASSMLILASVACGQPTPDVMNPSTLNAAPPASFVVRMETTKGVIRMQVNTAWAPNGAKLIYNLVRAGFYDNTYFFRNEDFVVQWGISSDPEVSAIWANRQIPDDRRAVSNTRGRVAFASRSTPNTRTTQLFISKIDNSRLDPLNFQPVGEIIEGMDVVDSLYAGYPQAPVQARLEDEGEPYLNRYFPRLDKIITATIE